MEPAEAPGCPHGDNPNRMGHYYQFQVIRPRLTTVEPHRFPERLGIERRITTSGRGRQLGVAHPGAAGLGWEVWLDGMEITQFTYFQEMGGFEIKPIAAELTYGLERITAYLQNVDNVWDIQVSPGITYGRIFLEQEKENSVYGFEVADVEFLRQQFNGYEEESAALIGKGLVRPAYDCALKCSHIFNLLDARGALSVAERQNYIGRIRNLTRRCAQKYLSLRGFDEK